jgi:hypothetical protein
LTFLFDENISQLVVDALKALGKPVAFLTDILPRGTDDMTLFSRLAEKFFAFLCHTARVEFVDASRSIVSGLYDKDTRFF